MENGSSKRVTQACTCSALWLACYWAACCTTGGVLGAEVRLREECRAGASVVRLGDVADISSADPHEAAALEQLELFAAPPTGRLRHVTAREIHEALVLAGFDLRKIRLVGAAQICVSGAGRQPMERPVTSPTEASLRRGKKLIEQAVRGALETPYGAGSWGLEWAHAPAAFAAAARPGATVDVVRVTLLDPPQPGEDCVAPSSTSLESPAETGTTSGLQPEGNELPGTWTRQPNGAKNAQAVQSMEFDVQIRITIGAEVSTHTLHVRATPRPQVVVARRTLAPGTVITPADIDLTEAGPTYSFDHAAPDGSTTVSRLQLNGRPRAAVQTTPAKWDECIGMETTRTVAAGQVLTADALRQPTLVKRGEAVTVYARSRGVVVRVTGRALESGSRGSLISVESLDNRQRFLARVSGLQEVVVEAEPNHAESDKVEPNGPAPEPYHGGQDAIAPASGSPETSQALGAAGPAQHRSYPVRRSIAEENGP